MNLAIFALIMFKLKLSVSSCPEGCVCSRARSMSCRGSKLWEFPRNTEDVVTEIDFSGNSLAYINSQTFSSFKKLTHLNLNHNDVEGISQGAFVSTPFMQNLNLSSNCLVLLERYSFTGLQLLMQLDLSGNQLTSLDEAFADLQELSKLNLCKNKLSRINEHTFKGLKNLRYLSLCQNKIEYIHKDSFRWMDELMYIVLKGNRLENVAELKFSSNYLSYIDLSECRLHRLPKGLPNSIRYLQLRRNNFTTLHETTFSDCRFVSILVLDDNLIKEISPGAFGGMVYLQQVWLRRNRLSTFNDILPSNVRKLSLHSNQFSTVPSRSFADLSFFNASRLTTLDLSQNPLIVFPAACFKPLTHLKKLRLSSISTIKPSIDANAFQGLEKLEELVLDNSAGLVAAITTSDELMSSLSGLRVLSMKRCQLSTLNNNFGDFFANLQQLEITSSVWCCDRKLVWFKAWLRRAVNSLNVLSIHKNTCRSPHHLKNKAITDVTFPTHVDEECHRSSSDYLFHIPSTNKKDSKELFSENITDAMDTYNINTILQNLNQLESFSSFPKDPTKTLQISDRSTKPTIHLFQQNSSTTNALRINISWRQSTYKPLSIVTARHKHLDASKYDDVHALNTFFVFAVFLVILIISMGITFSILIVFFVCKGITPTNKTAALRSSNFKVVSEAVHDTTKINLNSVCKVDAVNSHNIDNSDHNKNCFRNNNSSNNTHHSSNNYVHPPSSSNTQHHSNNNINHHNNKTYHNSNNNTHPRKNNNTRNHNNNDVQHDSFKLNRVTDNPGEDAELMSWEQHNIVTSGQTLPSPLFRPKD